MTEKGWQRTFIWGTAVFFALLVGMTVDSLRKVETQRTPVVTAQVARGKRVFQRRNCNDCHTILGIGGYFAPDLTKEADRRDSAWLAAFLTNPQQAKPGTTMPDQHLTEANVTDVIAFLSWVRHIDTNGWPPKPLSSLAMAPNRPTAPGAFRAKGCTGCHMVDGRGAAGPGPNLSHIGSSPYDSMPDDSAFLARWLADPPAVKPGTLMPKLPLSQAQRDSLVEYLLALK